MYVCMCVTYTYICIYTYRERDIDRHTCVYIYIYIHILYILTSCREFGREACGSAGTLGVVLAKRRTSLDTLQRGGAVGGGCSGWG